jgi:hypothetical protein
MTEDPIVARRATMAEMLAGLISRVLNGPHAQEWRSDDGGNPLGFVLIVFDTDNAHGTLQFVSNGAELGRAILLLQSAVAAEELRDNTPQCSS